MPSQNSLFIAQKSRVLAEIASSDPDASPKGSVDAQILPLINRLNQHSRAFTTSSCSGRISIFFEGLKRDRKPSNSGRELQAGEMSEVGDTVGKAGIGGKGEGGKWLFVSHDPVNVKRKSSREVTEMLLGKELDEIVVGEEELGLGSSDATDFDISSTTRFVHLKFEPMILHIQASDLQTAQIILTAALSAGFRESGIMNPGLRTSSFPMVAIRCNGLAMDSIIGIVDSLSGRIKSLVSGAYLKTLLEVCNLRFEDNQRRMENFSVRIRNTLFGEIEDKGTWEDKRARKERKREEGLKRQRELRTIQDSGPETNEEEVLGGLSVFSKYQSS